MWIFGGGQFDLKPLQSIGDDFCAAISMHYLRKIGDISHQ